MNLLHISDIHFRRQYPDCQEGYQGMLAAMQNPLIPLEECIRHAQQRGNIDLVVISGDLTEDGEVEDYRFLKEWLHERLGEVEMIVTLGNHDIKSHFRLGWCSTAASELPYNQVKRYSDMAIVSFDNSCYGASDGVVDEAQFQWLQQTLAELKELPIIFVTHHHLLAQQSSTPVWPGAERLLDLLASYNIRCILNGHTHHAFTGKVQGIPYYTVASMSFVGEDEGQGIVRFEERYGYNLYRFEEGKLIHQTSENYLPNRLLKVLDMSQD
ncbi:metallophosphoesterase [Enterococcus sp.]|jgi:Icc protein|uniref:metallophosphoesterase family protein n=1 Tax=Enterococcus sp. TaxID=35783 RepID=UPI0025C20069|nr:metallophosphoesterase [Enterococcus sp.]